jgi:hypothetical protein
MGARLWYHSGPWHADPTESLRIVQKQELREKWNLPVLLQTHLDSAREAVRLSESDDPYDLLDFYREELARLEALASRPILDDLMEQIELVRQVFASSGEGIGGILDVKHVSGHREMHVARRLSAEEVRRLCGVERPDQNQATAAIAKIHEELGRGESVCFPFHGPDAEPAGWYFVGNTID